ncbi:S-adenosyl-L-methionine-dependent methyltransferase [Hypoxylon sp. FL1150]|nr:S-adenosyl-L-methionine-dependent methyltransferase [Hypoxylon sp. FL1150]
MSMGVGVGGGTIEGRLDHRHQGQRGGVGPARASAGDDDAAAASSGTPREAVTNSEAANPGSSTGSHAPGDEEQQRQRVSRSPAAATNPASAMASAAESYEQQHVHSVYESIASHFSSTRYKPWPFVASFLASLAPGSIGLDVGCGNGKYLDVNRDVFVIASDRSANLTQLARDLKVAGAQEDGGARSSADVAGVADGLALPFGGPRRVDFAICIAVVHHLSTRERRVEGVRALLDCVAPGAGKVLVYVWALEQGSSRRGWDEDTADQDQLVPWVMRQNKKKQKGEADKKDGGEEKEAVAGDTTYQRYYHLYRKGELEEDVVTAGGEVLGSGYEKDNWWVIATPKVEIPQEQQ